MTKLSAGLGRNPVHSRKVCSEQLLFALGVARCNRGRRADVLCEGHKCPLSAVRLKPCIEAERAGIRWVARSCNFEVQFIGLLELP